MENLLDRNLLKKLFRVIKAPRDRAIFWLLYFFPLSPTDITRLRLADWKDAIELRFSRITVRRASRFGSAEFDLQPRRAQPYQARAVANAMRAWIRIRGRAHGWLFTSRFSGGTGGRITRQQIMRLLGSYIEESGLSPDKTNLETIQRLGAFDRREQATWRLRNWQ